MAAMVGTQSSKEPRTTNANGEELNQFNDLMSKNDYAGAAKYATGLGFSNDQIASYVGGGGFGINADDAKKYLNTGAYQAPSPSPSPQAQNIAYTQKTADANATPAQTQNLAYAQSQYQPPPTPAPTPAPSAFDPNNVGGYLSDFSKGKSVADVAGIAKSKGLTAADLGKIYGVSADDINKQFNYDGYLSGGMLSNAGLAYNSTPPKDPHAGMVNIGTEIWPNWVPAGSVKTQSQLPTMGSANVPVTQYYADGTLMNKLPSQYTLSALTPASQYSDIMDFTKNTAQKPNDVQVDPRSTSAYQLEQLTSQDSPMMQLAKKQGLLSAAARGDVNGSYAAGAAQAAMVQAAQPFALQDATTYNNQSLTNQAAQNQFQLTGYQKGLDTAGASYLANTDYLNRAALSDVLTNNTIQQQHLNNLDTAANQSYQNQYAIEQANNSAVNTQRTNYLQQYNDYLSKNALQDSAQTFDRWKTESNNQNAIALAGINNGAQLEQARIQAGAQITTAGINSETSKTNNAADNSARIQVANTQADSQRVQSNAAVSDRILQSSSQMLNNAASDVSNTINKAEFPDPTDKLVRGYQAATPWATAINAFLSGAGVKDVVISPVDLMPESVRNNPTAMQKIIGLSGAYKAT